MNDIDIVIPLGNGSRHDNLELRFAFRSLQKYFLNLRNIYVVGYKPRWAQNIIHIPFPDTERENKDANLINKVLYVCRLQGCSDKFIRMSDDQGLLKPMTIYEFFPYFNGLLRECKEKSTKIIIQRFRDKTGNIKEVKREVKNNLDNFHGNHWMLRQGALRDKLQILNKPVFQYDTHIPMCYDKRLFRKCFETDFNDYNILPGYTINSAYFNWIEYERKSIPQNLIGSLRVNRNLSLIQFNEYLKDKLFYEYNDKGFKDFARWGEKIFPEKSKYEI